MNEKKFLKVLFEEEMPKYKKEIERIKELEKPYNQVVKLLNELDGVELQWVIKKCYELLAED